MRQFDKYMEHFSDVPGWFEQPAIALWDSLLTFQKQSESNGHFVEIGVWKGRSAALMALHCEENESCVFVDVKEMEEARSRITEIVPKARCIYIQKHSQQLIYQPEILEIAGKARWVHIDGEHTSEAVMRDLDSADILIKRGGMVVVDDFFSPAYPQVTQAVFQYLMTRPNRFSLVLSGYQKAYLCRPIAAHAYLEFIKNSLYSEMSSRGFGKITIWKTTEPSEMNTFGITDQYLEFEYRGLDWNPSRIPI